MYFEFFYPHPISASRVHEAMASAVGVMRDEAVEWTYVRGERGSPSDSSLEPSPVWWHHRVHKDVRLEEALTQGPGNPRDGFGHAYSCRAIFPGSDPGPPKLKVYPQNAHFPSEFFRDDEVVLPTAVASVGFVTPELAHRVLVVFDAAFGGNGLAKESYARRAIRNASTLSQSVALRWEERAQMRRIGL